MIDSKVNGRGEQGPQGGLAGVVVVPDGCGQGEDALQDPDRHPDQGPTAVSLQVQLPQKVSLRDSISCRSGRNKSPARPLGSYLAAGHQDRPHRFLK
jgi:hypothetical protein